MRTLRWLLVAIAASSLFTMISLNRIDTIVHNTLYNFGLQFDIIWAKPYWLFAGIIFGLSWINILMAIILSVYFYKEKKPAPKRSVKTRSETVAQKPKPAEPAEPAKKPSFKLSLPRSLLEKIESQAEEEGRNADVVFQEALDVGLDLRVEQVHPRKKKK